MRNITIVFFLISFLTGAGQDFQNTVFKSVDYTQENLFSTNIEGPAFDKNGNLYVVNYQRDGTIGLARPDGTVELFVTLPQGSIANSIKFDRKGNMFLADFKAHNVLKVDMKTKTISTYVHNDAFNQPNDLCINRHDQLFVSDPNWNDETGKLWRIDKGGKCMLLTDQMGTANGIELSPDERVLYVNESVQRKIWAFDVDKKGNLSNKRLFAEFKDFGFDGMKCDKEGNLYVARYGKGTIAVLGPSGSLIREVELKGKNCSNLVFGGPDGKTVFVTLQDRKGMEKFRTEVAGRRY
jgi:gluconolactonase